MLYTSGDYYTEVMEYLYSHNINGILTDDPAFALLNPPRMFTAHDFKLTYKGSLETKEYFLHKMSKASNLKPDRYPLLASLLGWFVFATIFTFHLSDVAACSALLGIRLRKVIETHSTGSS